MKTPASFSKTCMAALFALTATPAFADAPACEGDESQVVGRVVARDGVAKAFRAGESEPRSLACNDVIHACETVTTEAGARIGILTSEVYAHLGSGSRLQISASETPQLALDAGRVRLIDPRDAGAPSITVRTPHLAAAGQGSDTEFFVNAGAVSTRLCNHLSSVDVTAGGSSLALETACAVSSGDQISELAAADPTIDVQDTPSCEFDVAALHSPEDVAPPPPGGIGGFPSSGPANAFNRGACEASACGVRVTPTPPTPPRTTPRPPPRTTRTRILVDPRPVSPTGGNGFGSGPPTN